MPPIIHTAESPEYLAGDFANQLIEWVNNSAGESFHLALSGGRTPSLLFTLLAEKYSHDIPWHKIHFWWGDERMVSPGDPESNFGVADNLLFSKIDIEPGRIHRIQGESNPQKEVGRYATEIDSQIPMLSGLPNFDLIILGLGDDGHTASIFPDRMELLDSETTTALVSHPETGQLRITLTGRVLNNAKKVAFLASGDSKSEIYNMIIKNAPKASDFPASHIHPKGELHWFIDQACLGRKQELESDNL